MEKIDKARELGRSASSEARPRIPALDSDMETLLEDLKVGESAKILHSWLEGYDEEMDFLCS